MKITKVNHQFRSAPVPRTSTKFIVIHHSDTDYDVGAATIHGWHLKNDNGTWIGIGYNYVIKMDGTIETGRPENAKGSHAGPSANGVSIGICLVGDFMKKLPTQAQLNSLVWLIKDIWTRYPGPEIKGHGFFMQTACPGNLFPWGELRQMLAGAPDVRLTINDRPTQVPLRVVDGCTEALLSGSWVQLRDLANMLHAEIGWDQVTKTVNFVIK